MWSNDLWAEAINTLGHEFYSYKATVNFTNKNKLKVLEDALEQTIEAKNLLDKKPWSIKWKNGEKATAPDVLRKVAK